MVLTGCQTGDLPHELARKSMELLAREVLPHVRLLKKLKYGARVLLSRRRPGRPSTSWPGHGAHACRRGSAFCLFAQHSGEPLWLPFPNLVEDFRVCARASGFRRVGGFDEIDTIEDMAFHYVELSMLWAWTGDPGRRQPGRLDRGGVGVPLAGACQVPVAVGRTGLRVMEAAARPVRPDGDLSAASALFHDPKLQWPRCCSATAGRGTHDGGLSVADGAGPADVGTALRSEAGGTAVPRSVSDAATLGRDDRLVPPAYGEAYKAPAAAEWQLIPKCGHLPMFEKETEFVEAVTATTSRTSPARRRSTFSRRGVILMPVGEEASADRKPSFPQGRGARATNRLAINLHTGDLDMNQYILQYKGSRTLVQLRIQPNPRLARVEDP